MEIIPIIKIRKRKIENTDIKELINFSSKNSSETPIYILDYDGIEENRPNLCTYQKLQNHFQIWADNGPNDLGDIVDSYMTGVVTIVIRKEFFKNFVPDKVKYISENKVILKLDYEDYFDYDLFIGKLDGYVNFLDREKIESEFKYKELLKKIYPNLYVYENDVKNISFWKKKSVKGIIVDFNDYMRFSDAIPS